MQSLIGRFIERKKNCLQRNRDKSSPFLFLGLLFVSGVNLVNRFIISIPNWLAIVFLVMGIICLFIHLVKYARPRWWDDSKK